MKLASLNEANWVVKQLFAKLKSPLFIVDQNSCVTYANPSFQLIFERPGQTYRNCLFGRAMHCIYAKKANLPCRQSPQCGHCTLKKAVDSALTRNKKNLEFDFVKKLSFPDREVKRYFKGNLLPIHINGQLHCLILLNNLTRLMQCKLKIEKIAAIDHLTGLINHYSMFKRLEYEVDKSLRYKNHFSLFLFDIDHFKVINDKYGQQTGDKILKAVAGYLKVNLRNIDIIARFGDDEFLIILPESTLDSAYRAADRIRMGIEEINVLENDYLKFTISGGVTQFDGRSTAKILEKVNNLLNKAKRLGKNRIEKKY